MAVTQTYVDWLKKCQECGFSNEQICGLSMLYYWKQTFRTSDSDEMDVESFWGFVTKEDFARNIQNITFQEEAESIIKTFQESSDFLRVSFEQKRYTSDGDITGIFSSAPENLDRYEPKLLEKHNFDLKWLERLGLSLVQEHRDPEVAYSLAEKFGGYLFNADPQAFNKILPAVLFKLSPILHALTTTAYVNITVAYIPFQLALIGFMGKHKIDESIWNLQRTIFYSQPEGSLIREELQKSNSIEFVNESLEIIKPFIYKDREFYFSISSQIQEEYILEANTVEYFLSRLQYLLKQRYQISDPSNDFDLTNVLINAACFYTVCCLLIKNISNPFKVEDNLKMATDDGLLWRLGKFDGNTEQAALTYFPKVLSWRSGVCSVMFIETQNNRKYFLYLPSQDDPSIVNEMFQHFALALNVRECTFTYFSEFKLKDETDDSLPKVIFLSSSQAGFQRGLIYKASYSTDIGYVIGESIGAVGDESFFKGFLDDVRENMQVVDDDKGVGARSFIRERLPTHDWDSIFED